MAMEKNPIPKEDVFLLGGNDLEMYQIQKRLRRAGKIYVKRNLDWGASIDHYNDVLEEILSTGDTPVAVELVEADRTEGVVDIDHHNEKAGRPSSLTQVMSRIGKPMGLVDEMIAANDSAYIPGMQAKMEEYRPQLVEKFGEERFEMLRTRLIKLIRTKDRQMQGVTPEMERQAADAIEQAEHEPNGLVIVRLPHDKASPVADRLFSTWPDGKENLLVVCTRPGRSYEISYFGRGDICKEFKERFAGAWGGGSGYGNADANAFAGCEIADPQLVIDFVTEKNRYIESSKT